MLVRPYDARRSRRLHYHGTHSGKIELATPVAPPTMTSLGNLTVHKQVFIYYASSRLPIILTLGSHV